MTDENFPPQHEPVGSQILSAFFTLTRIFARFILILLLMGLLATLIFGIPYVYWRFVTPAVSEYQHLASAQVEQEYFNQRLLDDLENIQKRAQTLETRLDSEKQRFGEIEQTVSDLTGTQQAQYESLHETQLASDSEILSLSDQIEALELEIADLSDTLNEFNSIVTSIEEKSKELETRLLSEDEPINNLRRDIQVLKAMSLMTRSRLFISQDNLGLAEADIQSARDILSDLQVPASQQEIKSDTLDRLELALENLPDAPEVAVNDLEIAWQLLKTGLFSKIEIDAVANGTSSPTPGIKIIIPSPSETMTPSGTP